MGIVVICRSFVRFREDDPFHGFPVRVGTMGMRLFASAYWKCAETACISEKKANITFVFSESLIEGDSSEFNRENDVVLTILSINFRIQRSNNQFYYSS